VCQAAPRARGRSWATAAPARIISGRPRDVLPWHLVQRCLLTEIASTAGRPAHMSQKTATAPCSNREPPDDLADHRYLARGSRCRLYTATRRLMELRAARPASCLVAPRLQLVAVPPRPATAGRPHAEGHDRDLATATEATLTQAGAPRCVCPRRCGACTEDSQRPPPGARSWPGRRGEKPGRLSRGWPLGLPSPASGRERRRAHIPGNLLASTSRNGIRKAQE
jgi:hypothetical protein